MKKYISIISFLIFMIPIAFSQEGVRYVKKQANSTEVKPTSKTSVNSERTVLKDSASVNKIENKNNNGNINSEKTSRVPKK